MNTKNARRITVLVLLFLLILGLGALVFAADVTINWPSKTLTSGLQIQYSGADGVKKGPVNSGTLDIEAKKDFSLNISNLKDEQGTLLFLFKNADCSGEPASTTAYAAFSGTKTFEWKSLNWNGVSLNEQDFCACQAKAVGDCASADTLHKASVKIRAAAVQTTKSIVEALANIDKKLVDGIFSEKK